MAIPSLPVPSLTDQTSFGPVSQTFGGVSYAPPSGQSNIQGGGSDQTVLVLTAGAVAVAAFAYYKWGRG